MKQLTLLVKPAAGLCNMQCKYCFYRSASETRENRIMSEMTVDTLILKIREYHPSALSVMFQGGEPTLAGLGFFEYFIDKANKNIQCPVSYALQTNGVLIDEKYAKFFKKNNFLIGISLDGDRKTNDRFRVDKNGESVFAQVLNAVELLKKYDVDFNILSVIDDENARDIESTYGFFKKQRFDYLQFIPYIDEGQGISLSAENYEYFLKKSFDLWYSDYINGKYISIRHIDNYIGIILGNPPENCAMCGVCGNYFVVEANGDLYPCDFYCNDKYRLGNIVDNKPFEANVKQKSFTEESHIIHSFCESCEYYFLCRGGCKRDRINGFTENRYCQAYKAFFDYARERMILIARSINNE